MLCFVMFPSNGAEWKEDGASGSSSRTTAASIDKHFGLTKLFSEGMRCGRTTVIMRLPLMCHS
jgi:hypothetical protein